MSARSEKEFGARHLIHLQCTQCIRCLKPGRDISVLLSSNGDYYFFLHFLCGHQATFKRLYLLFELKFSKLIKTFIGQFLENNSMVPIKIHNAEIKRMRKILVLITSVRVNIHLNL